jgi:Outer membrane protein beta-barrel domain
MSSPRWKLLMQRVSLLFGAAMFSAGFASAQYVSSTTPNTLSTHESSSLQYVSDDGFSGASALSEAAGGLGSGGGRGAGQYERKTGVFSVNHLAFEAGAGFNAPIGNDTPYITWGGNFTGGGGLNFNKRFSLLGEFQFMDNKLPGAFVAAGGGQGGNAHIISLTADPVVDLFPSRVNSIYVTGGGGYYHKSTNFTVEECCDFEGYPVNVTANSFTSNQGGVNIGLGLQHRVGGVYGDGKMKLFGEARYVYIHTPAISQTNGLGTTELIPVTFGLRF